MSIENGQTGDFGFNFAAPQPDAVSTSDFAASVFSVSQNVTASDAPSFELADFDIPQFDLDAARSTIDAEGLTSGEAVTSIFDDNQILAVGETHDSQTTIRKAAPEILGAAYDAGATKIFVESADQSKIDRFLETGEPSGLTGLEEDVVQTAHTLGFEVIAAEVGNPKDNGHTAEEPIGDLGFWGSLLGRLGVPQPTRNQNAATNVLQNLEQDEKAVVWFGSAHIAQPRDSEGNLTGDRSIPDLIERGGVSVGTLVGLDTEESSGGFSSLVAEQVGVFDTPKAIKTEDLPDSLTDLSTQSATGMEYTAANQLSSLVIGDFDMVLFPGADASVNP